jgi:hypothetical protein
MPRQIRAGRRWPCRTIALLITLTLAILVAPLAAGVLQPPTTVHRIGLLNGREGATMTMT